MRARVFRIGNSLAVLIPKLFLEQTGLRRDVEIEVQNHEIVIGRAERPRQAWAKAFRAMAVRADDRLLDMQSGNQSAWDQDEWHW